MTVPTDSVLRVAVRQTMPQGQDHVNVYHYACNFSDAQDEEDIRDALATQLNGIYSPMNSLIGTAQEALDFKVDVVELVSGKETVVANAGTGIWSYSTSAGGDVLPPGACAMIKLLTNYGKVWGRKFFSGLSEAVQNNGILSESALSSLATVAANILETVVISQGNSLVPCVLSKKLGEIALFTDYDCPADIAYQRRRRLGSGS